MQNSSIFFDEKVSTVILIYLERVSDRVSKLSIRTNLETATQSKNVCTNCDLLILLTKITGSQHHQTEK